MSITRSLAATTTTTVVGNKETKSAGSGVVGDKLKELKSRVLILGATGRVGGSTAIALSNLSPNLHLLLGGRNK